MGDCRTIFVVADLEQSMSNDTPRSPCSYVGLFERGELLAVGLVDQEALWRAKALGFGLSPDAKPTIREVSPEEYCEWWNNKLSGEQRERMRLAGGSQPPQ
jgi:hypothetical protein